MTNEEIWAQTAKNLMLGHTCTKCRYEIEPKYNIDKSKCAKSPRPPSILAEDQGYWEVPDIGTCPLFEESWRV